MPALDLWLIGNCQVSALIDRAGAMVWACVPRVDGDPLFSALLGRGQREGSEARGIWSIELEGCASVRQAYRRNTPILVSTFDDGAGNAMEVIDFCPRRQRLDRVYRPTAFARIVRPLAGAPRIRVRLRPTFDYGAAQAARTFGSNHIRYVLDDASYRLTTDAPVSFIGEELAFRLERPLHFFLGPDESFAGSISSGLEEMLEDTASEWQLWARGLATPPDWQDAVIRAAISLKLCQHEETGAIVAAITTSIPEHEGSERNWDYRYCWIRDAYYTVQALNRLGALDVLEGYLGFLRNVVNVAGGGHVQPLYSVLGEPRVAERVAAGLSGYRGIGPVRVGNQAHEQVQNDVYGQIVLSNVQAFFDSRLLRMSGLADFQALERVGERAWEVHDQPDAGLWEFRTISAVHTYSAAMCWAACDRLARAAEVLGLTPRRDLWVERARHIRTMIEQGAWRAEAGTMSATITGDQLDASLIQLLDLRFFAPADERFQGTLRAVEAALRRGPYMLRYATEDDFGIPRTAFNFCTFWLIEALHIMGRQQEARALFEEMLSRRTAAGLLSEDIDPESGELWGNYPQTYSLAGLINCALLLSRPWSAVR
ncbi:glycoside hydrolase family 15 protein [Aestuariivirga litoralis]|uniref:Glycoside hydrolase family 15 protein n=2 Tax=Aestuariivirga litoralis TaxID=2650924 RepID=A0A2W2APJ2_9HYPH|nr:glycoside hydrolase family 15 protein [Aestuariivirga litoralis]